MGVMGVMGVMAVEEECPPLPLWQEGSGEEGRPTGRHAQGHRPPQLQQGWGGFRSPTTTTTTTIRTFADWDYTVEELTWTPDVMIFSH